MSDPLDEIFLDTEKEKRYWKDLQDEKGSHKITEENRMKLLEENLELKRKLKGLSKIDKIENDLRYNERMILKLFRITGHSEDIE